jgi:hypothetical protein
MMYVSAFLLGLGVCQLLTFDVIREGSIPEKIITYFMNDPPKVSYVSLLPRLF